MCIINNDITTFRNFCGISDIDYVMLDFANKNQNVYSEKPLDL